MYECFFGHHSLEVLKQGLGFYLSFSEVIAHLLCGKEILVEIMRWRDEIESCIECINISFHFFGESRRMDIGLETIFPHLSEKFRMDTLMLSDMRDDRIRYIFKYESFSFPFLDNAHLLSHTFSPEANRSGCIECTDRDSFLGYTVARYELCFCKRMQFLFTLRSCFHSGPPDSECPVAEYIFDHLLSARVFLTGKSLYLRMHLTYNLTYKDLLRLYILEQEGFLFDICGEREGQVLVIVSHETDMLRSFASLLHIGVDRLHHTVLGESQETVDKGLTIGIIELLDPRETHVHDIVSGQESEHLDERVVLCEDIGEDTLLGDVYMLIERYGLGTGLLEDS